ncbi:threonine--tRNA ligase [Curtanaerobium respiraculi]|uniref:threonine--tRNA ligase n=1 Tax=Curtanaerobium respiraculi TaxID=2949669 RepID=UPI0024B3A5CC|nr:threonine--tRNA ligase [Curtanaerobium respiraculi]
MNIKLPDGSSKELAEGATVADVAAAIGPGLAKAALGGKINGDFADLDFPVHDGDTIEIITAKSPDALGVLRHSCAHVMAEAVQLLYPGAQIAFGPQTDDGFFYDFSLDQTISSDDFPAIEAKMAEIIARDEPFVREVVSREQAKEIFKDQKFKAEHINDLPEDEEIIIRRHGEFVDLCGGPHIPSAGCIGAFKLTKVAGAYWKGDADNEQLQRIYGTAFFKKRDLDEYLHNLEEAERRDHRKLGRELGIYVMDEMAGVGLPMYLPAGARVIRILQEWLRRELYRRGYEEVITPHIYKADVWKTSGHYGYYHDNMYFFNINEGSDDEPRMSEYGVKPMNCPGHVMLFKNAIHSYKEMPIRFFEFGTVYRHELSGAVHGLMRARGFTQDDAHVFCREDQVVDEVCAILDLADDIMGEFGFEYMAEISTRPEKSIGTDEMWEKAESFLRTAIERKGIPYEVNPGDGAFYGPKIDIKVKDAIGRWWQCSTVQVDFNLPERFDISYRTADNSEERPWMLHRALFGSIERFLGILIEHTTGNLPLWLAPTQAVVIPIADRHLDAAREIARKLTAAEGRVKIYAQNEPMRVKIAKAQAQKVPYMLVVGDKEIESGTVSVRKREGGAQSTMSVDDFVQLIADARVK